jgi:hypothetical protein
MSEISQLVERQRAAALAALHIAANDLAGRAQRDAPIEEGTLRASADVEVEETLDGADAIVSFSTPYAERQHEELGFEHPHGGQAKYLEAPFKEMVPRYEAVIAAAVKRVT